MEKVKRKPYYIRKTKWRGPGRPKLYRYKGHIKKKHKRIHWKLRKKSGYAATDPYTYLFDSNKNSTINLLNELYNYNPPQESYWEEWIRHYLNF